MKGKLRPTALVLCTVLYSTLRRVPKPSPVSRAYFALLCRASLQSRVHSFCRWGRHPDEEPAAAAVEVPVTAAWHDDGCIVSYIELTLRFCFAAAR